MNLDVALVALLTGQEAATTPPWVEYAVYGGLALVFLIIIIRSLRKPAPVPVEAEEAPVEAPRSEAEVEEEARQAFNLPQIELGAPGGGLRVRLGGETRRRPHRRGSEAAAGRQVPAAKAAPAKATPAKAAPAKAAPGKPAPAKAAPAAPEPPPAIEAAGRTLREGLARTHDGFVKKLGKLFGGAKTMDDALLADLEEALFTADIGVRTAQTLVEQIYETMNKRSLQDPAKVWAYLKGEIAAILQRDAGPLDLDRAKPMVIMVVGVNGAGKTTTIGKLARKFSDQGKKVLLAAGDTFRAAAVEQLEVWGGRAGVPVVRGEEKQDPSSVIFEACRRAQTEGFDVIIADTAGRLQARKELMDELAKIHRVIGKAMPGAPHEVWLVLDATNGQNAISQAQVFTEMVDVTGLVLTKLDGTAKGGVVIGISNEMRLPVRFIGIGEKVEDLRAFEPEAFVEALFAET
ncbi:MAG: signal recognition particle-docking protein FtsY [Myxococcales bacterium]|nr:signal recognition particle-docking protein FtsY [Myxococcales bacterium]